MYIFIKFIKIYYKLYINYILCIINNIIKLLYENNINYYSYTFNFSTSLYYILFQNFIL